MKRIRFVATLAAILGLPVVVAAADVVHFYSVNANNGSLISSGERREFLLYVPKSYNPASAAPLVISLHAAALWPASQMETSQWNKTADKYGFIVVYPSGKSGGGPRIFHVDTTKNLDKDVQFISDLIDTLKLRYDIDPSRVYANGLSNGGGMSFALSCALSNRIAAVGLVASAQTLPFSWCRGTTPKPVIAFHGTADPDTPYHGGVTWITSEPFPDIPAFMRRWSQRNHCSPTPARARVASDVVSDLYQGCEGGADVVLYTIERGGHTWPGGKPLPRYITGRTSNTINADELMWQFFRHYHLEAGKTVKE